MGETTEERATESGVLTHLVCHRVLVPHPLRFASKRDGKVGVRMERGALVELVKPVELSPVFGWNAELETRRGFPMDTFRSSSVETTFEVSRRGS